MLDWLQMREEELKRQTQATIYDAQEKDETMVNIV